MPPLRHTMGFVNNQHSNGHRLHKRCKKFILQPFRRYIYQLDTTGTNGGKTLFRFFKGTLAVDICSRNLLGNQGIDLIFHQRNER